MIGCAVWRSNRLRLRQTLLPHAIAVHAVGRRLVTRNLTRSTLRDWLRKIFDALAPAAADATSAHPALRGGAAARRGYHIAPRLASQTSLYLISILS